MSPIPSPSGNEDRNTFMSRCEKFVHDENKKKADKDKWTEPQMAAICYSKWKEHSKASLEEAAKEFGKGKSLSVNKSAKAMSTSSWGSVDKTALRNRILEASNYRALVHDVYLLVESGWESSPSSHLKYPVMQISGGTLVYNKNALHAALSRAEQQNESGVVSKVHGLYKKLGIQLT